MSMVYGYAVAALVAVAGFLAVYVRGRKSSKAAEETKQAKADLAGEQTRNANLKAMQDVADNVRNRSDDDVVRELRNKWTRKGN